MKRILSLHGLMMATLMGSLLTCTCSTARADDIELRRLLHGPQRCDHVISLLMRHGVNNDSNQANAMNAFHPLGPIAIPAADLGDLELISVSRRAETIAGCGPSFDVVIKNCSTRDVCGSRVTLVGLFGRILPSSPNVTAKVESLPPGQAIQMTLTLPIESLAMGNLNGQMIGLNRLLVVIDSFDQFMESNEANNLRVFDVAAIPVSAAPAAVPPTAATPDDSASPMTPQSSATPQSSVRPETQPNQPQATQVGALQTDAEPASPSDSAAGLSSPDLQSAINQFSTSATTDQDDS